LTWNQKIGFIGFLRIVAGTDTMGDESWEVVTWRETGFQMDRGETREMFTFSLLSAISCLAVLVSLFVFREDLKKKPATPVMFNIFISNLFTSIGSLPGVPIDQSFGCWFEGIVTNIFTLSALLWTVVITWVMYSTIAYRTTSPHSLLISSVCWGIPILATFLPFINSSYGAPSGEGWCWVIDTARTPDWGPQFWFWMSFYAWVWITFFAILFLFVLIIYKARTVVRTESNAKKLKSVMMNLAGYPIAILISWIASTFVDFYVYNRPDIELPDWVIHLNYALDCGMGLMCAIVFFSSQGIRTRWWTLHSVGYSMQQYRTIMKVGLSQTEKEIVIKPLAAWSQQSDLKPKAADNVAVSEIETEQEEQKAIEATMDVHQLKMLTKPNRNQFDMC